MNFISPSYRQHEYRDTLDFKIELFRDRIDGWHLEVADRCINGWENKAGEQSIRAFHRNGNPTYQIPDSGWAVLQIVLNYFETIAWFKLGKKRGLTFKAGFEDVFPQFIGHQPDIAIIVKQLRDGLYHTGLDNSKIIIRHTIESLPIEYNKVHAMVVIDPHKFIPSLRKHFANYVERLKDPSEVVLRDTFENMYNKKYKKPSP